MRSTSIYVLASRWKKVVSDNTLIEGQRIRLWSFHSLAKLYIALVPLDPAPAPTLAILLAPAPTLAILLAPAPTPSSPPVVTRDSDELYISHADAQEEGDRILPVHADNDWECLNLLAKVSEETTCLEVSQEANRRSSLVSDTELDLELRLSLPGKNSYVM